MKSAKGRAAPALGAVQGQGVGGACMRPCVRSRQVKYSLLWRALYLWLCCSQMCRGCSITI